jgi:ribosomal protein L7/L12
MATFTRTTKFTKQHVADALNLFELLEYGQGKAAAATVVNSVVKGYMRTELAPEREKRAGTLFTNEEVREMRAGRKLQAIKLVKRRLGMGLMDSKRYVEANGGQFLAQSGQYDMDGQYILDHRR